MRAAKPVDRPEEGAPAGFASFAALQGPRLVRALTAAYGIDVGPDAGAEALAWAYEHWDRVETMGNPGGYLYRVGQTAARRLRRDHRQVVLPAEVSLPANPPDVPALDDALARLSAKRRAIVVLVHGYGWSYAEVAKMLDLSEGSVRNHLHRAMKTLRHEMERP